MRTESPHAKGKTVKKILLTFLGVFSVAQVLNSPAQIAQKVGPGFKLTLSPGNLSSHGQQSLLVTYTNTSRVIYHDWNVFGHAYQLVEVYNGTLVEEKQDVRNYRLSQYPCQSYRSSSPSIPSPPAQESTSDGVVILNKSSTDPIPTFSGPMINVKPGQSKQNDLYSFAKEPGTYRFTVQLETNPCSPEKNITVKSNTLTIVVPAQDPDKKN
jgi:hypothetical protein